LLPAFQICESAFIINIINTTIQFRHSQADIRQHPKTITENGFFFSLMIYFYQNPSVSVFSPIIFVRVFVSDLRSCYLLFP
jgi:hypothetical protein